MSDSVLLRLFWKEYRVQRNFWISVAVVALLGQLLVLGLPKEYLNRPDWLFGLALACPALFALGCGASLFAGEREDGTFEQLRILAAPADRVLTSKLGFAVVGTVGLLGTLWLIALQLAGGELPTSELHRSLWSVCGVACVEALAWGLFFSLLTKRPLNAALLAAVAICLTFPLMRIFSVLFEPSFGELPPLRVRRMPDILTTPLLVSRVCLAIVVLCLDVAIALRWVLERPQIIRRAVGLTRIDVPRLGRPIGHLVWQECRQATRTIAVLLVVVLLIVVIGHVSYHGDGFDLGMAMFLMGVLSAVAGACVFLSEQEDKQFRFCADHGIAAAQVWWSKHLVWLPATLAMVLIVLLTTIVAHPLGPWPDTNATGGFDIVQFAIFYPIFGYCSGQLFSMLIPRGLIAGFFSLILTILLAAWFGLMSLLGVGLWWSVWPIPVVLLVATRVRAADWMLERTTWSARARLFAVLGVPAATLLVGVAAYRVFEIPASGPGFSPEEFLRPVLHEETETAELYRSAIAIMTPLRAADPATPQTRDPDFAKDGWDHAAPQEREWLAANQKSVERTLDASRRDACVFRDPKSMRFDDSLKTEQDTRHLAWLLLLDARRLESEGQLDEALDRYLAMMRLGRHVANRGTYIQWLQGSAIEGMPGGHLPLWACHPEQTPERVRKALRELETVSKDFPPASDAVKAEYVVLRRVLESDPAEIAAALGRPEGGTVLVLWGRLMPWEVARACRLQNVLTARDLATVEMVERELAASHWEFLTKDPFFRGVGSDQSAEYAQQLVTTPYVQGLYPAAYTMMQGPVRRATQLRAFRIIIALKSWQAEHGELPRTLVDLVGEYFDRLPADPFTGQAFGYKPEGFPTPIYFAAPNQFEYEPGTPVLWSASFERAQLVQYGANEQGIPHYQMLGQQRNSFGYRPAGWAFPIP